MAAEPRPVTGVKIPSELASHEMRITQGGKIHAWVEFALKFFEVREFRHDYIAQQNVYGYSGERRESIGITHPPRGGGEGRVREK